MFYFRENFRENENFRFSRKFENAFSFQPYTLGSLEKLICALGSLPFILWANSSPYRYCKCCFTLIHTMYINKLYKHLSIITVIL
jgi:hypothetical protein